MATYLLKTEPDCYSYSDLMRDKRTHWNGVTNAAAQKHMRSIKKGDEVFIYHTADEKRIVGLAKVVRGAYQDPENTALTAAGEPRSVLIDITPARAATRDGATLTAIKADARFENFDLVRQSRLGVMPVEPRLDKILRTMAGL
ncbi:MAG: EVE domain-containing protein [Phycisphaeraceae bacterium]|nr:EVE domain-containing protein [Phycisphaeraceae bacterium]MCW5763115.1 EVE domain-containing protein [Phycisphaeraceae bacterium]